MIRDPDGDTLPPEAQNVQQNDEDEENEEKKPGTKNVSCVHPSLRRSKPDQTYL